MFCNFDGELVLPIPVVPTMEMRVFTRCKLLEFFYFSERFRCFLADFADGADFFQKENKI